MTIKTLYRYERDEGGITVSPQNPDDVPYTSLYRIVADEHKLLTDGIITAPVIDTENPNGWEEIPAPEDE